MRLMYAITAHGWGHFTRSAALLQALHEVDPTVEFHLSTALPEAQLRDQLPFRFTYRAADYEPGVAQRSCLDSDLKRTIADYRGYCEQRPRWLAAEQRYLTEQRIDAVISDIAALPVRAAGALGLPAVGVANFTWDWILEPLLAGTDASDVPDLLREDYAHGRELFLLPFGQSTSSFAVTTQVPVLARHRRASTADALRTLGLSADANAPPIALVCLGGWQGSSLPPITVEPGLQARFVASEGLAIDFPNPAVTFGARLPGNLVFPDLVAAADIVITKPGYGIASECVTQATPVLMVAREGFREAPELCAALAASHPTRVLDRATFAAGRWGSAVRELLAQPRPAPQATDNHGLATCVLASLRA